MQAIELGGPRNARFDPPLLLAPMEGVTDPSFRGLVIESNPAGSIGGASTEFLRVTGVPMRASQIAAEYPGPHDRVCVGVQFMGNEPEFIAASAVRAAELGAPYVDLNFGCPAPRVFQHRAGCALLATPDLLERMVRVVVEACPVPVTAKIRSGIEDDRDLEDLARRIEAAGAAALTVHARLRIERYSQAPDWTRIRRAVEAVAIPVIGNGSAEDPASIDAMVEQTGCAGVMVGRGAMGNPWVFGDWLRHRRGERGQRPDVHQCIEWLREYANRMERGGAKPIQSLGRLKQAVKAMHDSGTLDLGEARGTVLRSQERAEFLAMVGRHGRAAELARAEATPKV